MLPFVTRNRKILTGMDQEDITAAPGEVLTAVKSTAFKLRRLRLPGRFKLLLFLVCLIAVVIYGKTYVGLGKNRLTDEEFLGVQKCPACYGSSLCFEFFDDQIQLSGISRYSVFDTINLRNVHFAFHKYKEHDVVIKKLGFNSEIKTIDDQICEDSFRKPGCDLAQRFVVSQTAQDITKNGLSPKHLKDTTFMFMCPTHRLIDRVLEKYVEKNRGKHISIDTQLQILYTAKVNPEPLLLQTFPTEEGWPFPRYYGACGRYVVVEHGGKPLAEYYNAPWEKRADLAFQMIAMAEKLTQDENWALYWTDLDYYNFAVDPSGKLSVIDVENVIVVDRHAVKLVNKDSWNILSESRFDDCNKGGEDSGNCLSFDFKELCTHYEADLNYYAVCRNMLSKYADERNMPDGLLHNMPAHAKDDWDLENLLNECARPTQSQGRIKVIPKLKEAFKQLRNVKVKTVENKDYRIT